MSLSRFLAGVARRVQLFANFGNIVRQGSVSPLRRHFPIALIAASLFASGAAYADPPVITILGNNPENVIEGDTYVDAGATALDPEEGDLTGSIIVTNNVNTSIPDTYTVDYEVTDAENFTVNASRTVNVLFNNPPVISIIGSTSIQVAQGDTYNDAGATASDVEDGDLTGSIITNNPVDTNTPAVYQVTYQVTDSNGKSDNQIRTVTVVANSPPVITANGSLSVQVNQGDTYIDAGATASDAEDGDLTGSIVTTNLVDTSTPGNYTVTYEVTDSGGLTDTVIRNVAVLANSPPVITANGSLNIQINQGDTYNDAGATASDAEDGDLTGSIVTTNLVDTSTPGNYTVTYQVTDSGGLSDTVIRNVEVLANNPPVINITGPTTINLTQGDTYNDAGATASDAEDGDLTGSIVTNSNVDTSTPGTYQVNYSVTDSGGLSDSATRTVNVAANNPPVINITGPATINLTQGDTYNDAGATATDDEDGDLTGSIVTNSNVDTSTPGTYQVNYSVTDSGGLSDSATRTVNVAANNPPVINITGPATINLTQGDTYNDAGATATDDEDGDLTGSIVTNSNVDTSTPGTYQVNYSVTDSGGLSDSATRTVNVAANNPPVINITGPATINLTQGDTYNDAGATASDPEDGNLTGSIVTNSNVDTSTPGTYQVNYSVTDSGGLSDSATRTVNVAANNPPVINITGPATINLNQGDTYNDAGATASVIPEDGDLTGSIVTNSNVDTSTPGTYQVNYSVTDSGGLSDSATRTVNVAANNPPVININGTSDNQPDPGRYLQRCRCHGQ